MHDIFSKFVPYSGAERQNVDWIGMRYDEEWWAYGISPDHPHLNEEYFEWIDLLEAAASCRGAFTMVELGAGFGRWGIRGAIAARQLGVPTLNIRFVEAEPQHAVWIEDAITLNNLRELNHRVVQAAISYAGKPVLFAIATKEFDARSWYGQALSRNTNTGITSRTYFGRPVIEGLWHDAIEVEAITFEALTSDLALIDLVDMDIQGAERELIENAIDTFNEKVRLVHIGTHSVEIENAIREVFQSHGWHCRWDFSLQGERETPFGRSRFGDGVQGWSNPRFWGVEANAAI